MPLPPARRKTRRPSECRFPRSKLHQGLHIVLADDPFLQNADLFIHESGSQKSCGMWNAPQPSSIYCTHKRTRLLHSSFLILPATCSGVKYPGLIYNDIRR